MEKNTKKAAIFDLDGTLYVSDKIDKLNELASIKTISEHLNISEQTAKKIFLDKRTISNSDDLKPISRTFHEMNIPLHLIGENQIKYIVPKGIITKNSKLVRLIRKLRDFYKISLLTNSKKEIAIQILHQLGFNLKDFDLIITGDDLIEFKPSTNELKNCINTLDVFIEESIMIGDRWHVDLEPAKEIGMRVLMVNHISDLYKWIENEITRHECE